MKNVIVTIILILFGGIVFSQSYENNVQEDKYDNRGLFYEKLFSVTHADEDVEAHALTSWPIRVLLRYTEDRSELLEGVFTVSRPEEFGGENQAVFFVKKKIDKTTWKVKYIASGGKIWEDVELTVNENNGIPYFIFAFKTVELGIMTLGGRSADLYKQLWLEDVLNTNYIGKRL